MINKRGMELSINFIVILVITLIVFGGTMGIAVKVLNSADDMKKGLDKQTEERLESMMRSGTDQVVIAFNKKETKPGEAVTFGVGILNTLGADKTFNIVVSKSMALHADGTEITSTTWDSGWNFIKSFDIGTIKNNDYKVVSVVFIPPKTVEMGATYVFDVRVRYLGTAGTLVPYPQMDPIKKVRITII